MKGKVKELKSGFPVKVGTVLQQYFMQGIIHIGQSREIEPKHLATVGDFIHKIERVFNEQNKRRNQIVNKYAVKKDGMIVKNNDGSIEINKPAEFQKELDKLFDETVIIPGKKLPAAIIEPAKLMSLEFFQVKEVLELNN